MVYMIWSETYDCWFIISTLVHHRVSSIAENAAPCDEVVIVGDFNLSNIAWKQTHSVFFWLDHEASSFHTGAMRLLGCYSFLSLFQINGVTNENNRSLDLCLFFSTLRWPPHQKAHNWSPLVVGSLNIHTNILLVWGQFNKINKFTRSQWKLIFLLRDSNNWT